MQITTLLALTSITASLAAPPSNTITTTSTGGDHGAITLSPESQSTSIPTDAGPCGPSGCPSVTITVGNETLTIVVPIPTAYTSSPSSGSAPWPFTIVPPQPSGSPPHKCVEIPEEWWRCRDNCTAVLCQRVKTCYTPRCLEKCDEKWLPDGCVP
ncbi:hypothetical protein QBC35DRAFT_478720 [Podospora australis]|uniref:Uncharacterized protein n=1 Tax=Podospora australis TaxID=1536484 RepID=A0AAN7ADR5_9PEZI|nr:hypothetical protein QBC35DRAFT_478720 [Podospora australis]